MADVVVVGSGGGGLAAALSAASRGAEVTVLESAPVFGGTSAISGGAMWLPRLEEPIEARDVPLKHLKRLTLGRVADSVLERYIDEAPNLAAFFANETPLTLWLEHRPDYHAELEGGALDGRTIYPTLFDTNELGEWSTTLRRAEGTGFAPVIQEEQRTFQGSREAFQEMVRERTEKGIVGRGGALIGGLMAGCLARGVQLLAGVRATGLEMSDGRVTGVLAEREGRTERFDATSGVVLACGGFEWDRRLWDELIGVPFDGAASPPYNVGDGLRLAMRAGARLGNINQVWWTPARYLGRTYEGKPHTQIGVFGAMAGEMTVNRKGRRFANESLNYNDIGKLMMHFDPHTYEFPNSPSFVIADQRAHVQRPLEGSDGDPVFESNSLRDLAEKAGIDPRGLEEQVREFNTYAENGVDPVFHRGETPWELFVQHASYEPGTEPKNKAMAPIEEPPFYAYRVRAGCFGTKGGPVIDANAQVVGLDERPIPGLYATGNVTAGIFGPAYPGGGGTLGPAVTFGYIAGISATKV